MSLRFHLTGLTDIGRVRRRNEDSLALDPDLGIAVVADGMGGHPGGDAASRTAADHALGRLRALLVVALPHSTTLHLDRAISEVVVRAHEAVRARAEREPSLAGMGTTLTALVASAGTGAWALGHVGDSRAYLLRHGSFRQLTRDDTWVQQRVEADQLTPAQARRHPYRHILAQCLGLEDAPTPQVVTGSLLPGDVFLLCSDGLTGLLDDDLLADTLRAHARQPGVPADVEGAARTLIASARERGAPDNVTVALLAVS